MFVVTFLDFSTFKIKILGMKETETAAREFLYAQAKEYVLQKDGERNMVIVAPGEVQTCPVVLGHFLCEIEQDCLDLYDKTQTISVGMVYTSVYTDLKKLGRYQISQTCDGSQTLDEFVDEAEFAKIPEKKKLPLLHMNIEFKSKFGNVLEEMVQNGYKNSLKNVKKD